MPILGVMAFRMETGYRRFSEGGTDTDYSRYNCGRIVIGDVQEKRKFMEQVTERKMVKVVAAIIRDGRQDYSPHSAGQWQIQGRMGISRRKNRSKRDFPDRR